MSGLRDPTRSQGLRNSGRVAVKRRVFELHKRLRLVLQEQDLVGLRQRDVVPEDFMSFVESDAGRLDRAEFMLRRIVMEALETPPDWLRALIQRSVQRGVEQVGAELSQAIDDLDVTDVALFHTRAAGVEVEGISDETRRRMLRSVVRAVETRASPEQLMREVREMLRRVTKLRLIMLINTAVVRAVNAGKLFGYRAKGINRVGIEPEWLPGHMHDSGLLHDRKTKVSTKAKLARARASTKRRRERMRGLPNLVSVQTAGDDKVCIDCQSLSANGPYEIDDPTVTDMIPVHPNCRCAFVPWDDRRYSVNR